MENFAQVVFLALACTFSGFLMTTAAFALGGWIVFRTKREAHESLFPSFRKADDEDGPVNIDPTEASELMPLMPTIPGEEMDEADRMHAEMTTRFLAQLKAETDGVKPPSGAGPAGPSASVTPPPTTAEAVNAKA